MIQNQICRVTIDYNSSYPDPLIVKFGDKLTVDQKKSEWDGWVWCTEKTGRSGWVPKSFIRRDGRSCEMIRDYNATELTAKIGEELTVIEKESGWVYCRDRNGKCGWLPLDNTDIR